MAVLDYVLIFVLLQVVVFFFFCVVVVVVVVFVVAVDGVAVVDWASAARMSRMLHETKAFPSAAPGGIFVFVKWSSQALRLPAENLFCNVFALCTSYLTLPPGLAGGTGAIMIR